jgi:hypothetical protein
MDLGQHGASPPPVLSPVGSLPRRGLVAGDVVATPNSFLCA